MKGPHHTRTARAALLCRELGGYLRDQRVPGDRRLFGDSILHRLLLSRGVAEYRSADVTDGRPCQWSVCFRGSHWRTELRQRVGCRTTALDRPVHRWRGIDQSAERAVGVPRPGNDHRDVRAIMERDRCQRLRDAELRDSQRHPHIRRPDTLAPSQCDRANVARGDDSALAAQIAAVRQAVARGTGAASDFSVGWIRVRRLRMERVRSLPGPRDLAQALALVWSFVDLATQIAPATALHPSS